MLAAQPVGASEAHLVCADLDSVRAFCRARGPDRHVCRGAPRPTIILRLAADDRLAASTMQPPRYARVPTSAPWLGYGVALNRICHLDCAHPAMRISTPAAAMINWAVPRYVSATDRGAGAADLADQSHRLSIVAALISARLMAEWPKVRLRQLGRDFRPRR